MFLCYSGFNPYRLVTSPVTGQFGLRLPCHDRVVSFLQRKALVWFQCAEWGKKFNFPSYRKCCSRVVIPIIMLQISSGVFEI